jgi:hypothetical protein
MISYLVSLHPLRPCSPQVVPHQQPACTFTDRTWRCHLPALQLPIALGIASGLLSKPPYLWTWLVHSYLWHILAYPELLHTLCTFFSFSNDLAFMVIRAFSQCNTFAWNILPSSVAWSQASAEMALSQSVHQRCHIAESLCYPLKHSSFSPWHFLFLPTQ